MKIPDYELLLKMGNEPGHSTKEEATEVYDWLVYFNSHLAAYKEAFGEPAGRSVFSLLDKIKYYKDRD